MVIVAHVCLYNYKIGGFGVYDIPMVSEQEARRKADVFLVGPYFFKKEILEREKDTILKLGKIFVFPLPELIVIDRENYHEHV